MTKARRIAAVLLLGSLIALTCAASSGGTPGCDSRYSSSCAVVAPLESTVGTRVCAITRVGTFIPLPPAKPHTSIRAGPALTTSVLPSMVDGIGLTRTPAFEADDCRRAASKVSDPVAWETTP